MILCVADVLTTEELTRVREVAAHTTFEDGAATAGWHARAVKSNLQASMGSAGGIVEAALRRHPVFASGALPQAIRPVLFNRYDPEMSYGTHVDNALMGEPALMRADISVTVFLSNPDSYDGGALVIESTAGEQAYKLAAGSAVIYPATTLHRVAPVASGERLAAITWVQSAVRDPARREILFDLDAARLDIFQREGKSPAFDRIAKSYTNLLRMWAEV